MQEHFQTRAGRVFYKYVWPESVEGIVAACKWVGQVWVYGNSFESYVVAIVVPDMGTSKPGSKMRTPARL